MTTTDTTPAVRNAAGVLRDSLNICGDDRKCQCEEAVTISETVMTDAIADAINLDRIASIAHTAITAWKADREAYGISSRYYTLDLFVAMCLRAAILGVPE